jgi:hypothetical protein
LDKWTEQAGASAAGTKKSLKACSTAKSCSTAKASTSSAGTKKACTDLPTQGNLLGKGAAAAARYINTFGTIKHYDDMDEFD